MICGTHSCKYQLTPTVHPSNLYKYKKLSCRREIARCFVSLTISLSHSSSLKAIESDTIRKLGYGFLFAFHSNYGSSCIISEIKPDISRKSRFFSYRLALMTPLGGRRRSITMTFGVEKLEWCEQSLMMCLAVSIEYRRVTDTRTDRRTDILRQHSSCYAQHRAVKTKDGERLIYVVIQCSKHRARAHEQSGSTGAGRRRNKLCFLYTV